MLNKREGYKAKKKLGLPVRPGKKWAKGQPSIVLIQLSKLQGSPNRYNFTTEVGVVGGVKGHHELDLGPGQGKDFSSHDV